MIGKSRTSLSSHSTLHLPFNSSFIPDALLSTMAEEKGTRSHADSDSDRLDALNRFRSAASISMTPELFEKLYLAPQSKVKGQLRDTFGNPTPM